MKMVVKRKEGGSGLAKILGIAIVFGLAAILLPNRADAEIDALHVGNKLETKTDILHAIHYTGAQEGSDAFDNPYGVPLPPEGWVPKITTKPYGTELDSDARPEDSETDFEAILSSRTDGRTISKSNTWSFVFEEGAPFDGPDTNRHYEVYINVSSNHTEGGQTFTYSADIRDIIANGGWVNGPQLVGLTNDCDYGTLTVSCPFNRLVSSSTSGGSNDFEGNQIMPYNSSTSVVVQADQDYHIADILENGESTGEGIGSNSYTYVFDNIKGSNNLHSVFEVNKTINGIPYTWFRPYYTNTITDGHENLDADGDGANNLNEFITGTEFTNSASCFRISSFRLGNSLELEIPYTSPSTTYYVDYSTNLVTSNWQTETFTVGSDTNPVTEFIGTGDKATLHIKENGESAKYLRTRAILN